MTFTKTLLLFSFLLIAQFSFGQCTQKKYNDVVPRVNRESISQLKEKGFILVKAYSQQTAKENEKGFLEHPLVFSEGRKNLFIIAPLNYDLEEMDFWIQDINRNNLDCPLIKKDGRLYINITVEKTGIYYLVYKNKKGTEKPCVVSVLGLKIN